MLSMRTPDGSWYWRADTPEAQRPGFDFEKLPEAQDFLSSKGVAVVLRGRGQTVFTSAELEKHMRKLGVRNPAAMRARMALVEPLSASPDNTVWTLTDPRKLAAQREGEVKKRFLVNNRLPAISTDPADRRLVLRNFADMLPTGMLCDDAMLASRGWAFRFGDVATIKQLLLDEGLIEAVEGGVVKYGLSTM